MSVEDLTEKRWEHIISGIRLIFRVEAKSSRGEIEQKKGRMPAKAKSGLASGAGKKPIRGKSIGKIADFGYFIGRRPH